MQDEYITHLRQLRANAYVPDSHFPVAALCIAGDRIAAGVNWEVQDRTIGTCGEMASIMNLVSAGGLSALHEMHMMGGNIGEEHLPKTYSCCASCRQFMAEIDERETATVTSVSVNGIQSSRSKVMETLPDAFVFRNYIDRPIDACNRRPVATAPLILKGIGNIRNKDEAWLHAELINCAHRSYAPDQSYLQGAIIITNDDRAYCGSLFQTANHRSSKNALTAALTMMISFDGIQNIRETHFLHIENRPHYKSAPNFFPSEMLYTLTGLGTERVIIHDYSDIVQTIHLNEQANIFNAVPISISGNHYYKIPEKYRG